MWVQLKRGNDWGHHYLAPEPLTATGFAEASRGLKFSGTVRVLFPDEHEDELPVVNVKTVERVNDMGHESTAVSEVPHIQVTVHGVDVLVPLDQEGLRVWVEPHPSFRSGMHAPV